MSNSIICIEKEAWFSMRLIKELFRFQRLSDFFLKFKHSLFSSWSILQTILQWQSTKESEIRIHLFFYSSLLKSDQKQVSNYIIRLLPYSNLKQSTNLVHNVENLNYLYTISTQFGNIWVGGNNSSPSPSPLHRWAL